LGCTACFASWSANGMRFQHTVCVSLGGALKGLSLLMLASASCSASGLGFQRTVRVADVEHWWLWCALERTVLSVMRRCAAAAVLLRCNDVVYGCKPLAACSCGQPSALAFYVVFVGHSYKYQQADWCATTKPPRCLDLHSPQPRHSHRVSQSPRSSTPFN
jgi:hypothetical protein